MFVVLRRRTLPFAFMTGSGMVSTQRGRVPCAIAIVLCMFTAPSITRGQGGTGIDLDRLGTAGRTQTQMTQLLTAEQIPTDDVVDPTAYLVGPGDVLAYQITGFDFSEKMSVVTPESTLLLERYGLLNVADMTLAQVRSAITDMVKRRSAAAECFVTLRRARLVYITVKGNVPFPGTYAVPASMRVSTCLNVTRQPWLLRKDAAAAELGRAETSVTTAQRVDEITRGRSGMLSAFAARNILIRRRKGITHVDLVRAMLPGQTSLDPHLREGDEINVPFDDLAAPMMSIGGAVATPSQVAYKPGDKVSVLLAAGGGPTFDADMDRVLLVQPGEQGIVNLRVDSSFMLVGDDVSLQPGSAVIIERRSLAGEPARQGVVEVRGEVVRQGAVIIEPGVTRLADVIARAGGITATASAALAYVVRPEQTSSQRRTSSDYMMRFLYSDLTVEDTLRFKLDEQFRMPYVSCDVASALRDSRSQDNILLQSGDIIVVPRAPERIYVYGQVQQPGYVPFEKGKNLEWYVNRAGGLAQGAKPGRARVVKGKSRVWLEDEETVIEPGDEVYVPRKPDVPAGLEVQQYAAIVGIASSATAIISVIYSLLRY